MDFFVDLFDILFRDLIFVGLLILLMLPVAMYKVASFAVLKRNFIGYFNNPTGYVFLCLFVLLTSFAAFWPHEFFNSNMATLDQLNEFLPYIMLIFIPAITMSIWAEERRQGTDELLLTIPAGDFDIVLGKYLAAAAIFTASLLFSELANFFVLNTVAMGGVDVGLFFTTYMGFWLIGLAMLSIGMVASFLTRNLTVGFILGAAFNAPLVFAFNADVIIGSTDIAQVVRSWSVYAQFEDFGRGVISISSVVYFATIVAVGMYLSMILIGRRHWVDGKAANAQLLHYVARSLSLGGFAIAATIFFTNNDWVRYDASTQKISSLSESTRRLISKLDLKRPVEIDAYISRTLPESFIRIQYDMVALLDELRANGGGKVIVNIHDDMEAFSIKAKDAQDRHGIRPITVQTVAHGSLASQQVFLSAVFTCGLERVVIPFFNHGSNVEYEIVRSISTVAQASSDDNENSRRRKIGILRTDAELAGTPLDDRGEIARVGAFPPQALIDELQRQYDLEHEEFELRDGRTLQRVAYHDRNQRIPGGFLFRLNEKLTKDLDSGELTKTIRKQFESRNLGLADAAVFTVDEKGKRWKITDTKTKYTIRQVGDGLDVREEYAYDVLIVAQPSTLNQTQLDNLLDAIQRGQPTLICEDPYPHQYAKSSTQRLVPGTDLPRPAPPLQAIQIGWSPPPTPKGNIRRFWASLGVGFVKAKQAIVLPGSRDVEWRPYTAVVWQNYNPYPKVQDFGAGAVFANPNVAMEQEEVFNPKVPAVTGLDEVVFEYPGAIMDRSEISEDDDESYRLKVIPLVQLAGPTGILGGAAPDGSVLLLTEAGIDDFEPEVELLSEKHAELTAEQGTLATDQNYMVAAYIRSKTKDELSRKRKKNEKKKREKEDDRDKNKVNVVVVADLDVLGSKILNIRNRQQNINFRFQNSAFILNLIDKLGGDERFLDIRARQPDRGSLKLVEDRIRQAIENMEQVVGEFRENENKKQLEEKAKDDASLEELDKEIRELQAKHGADSPQVIEARDMYHSKKAHYDQQALRRQRDNNQKLAEKLQEEQRNLNLDKRKIQNKYKFWAVVMPPIPPLLVGVIVFFRRRLREREGVSRNRLR